MRTPGCKCPECWGIREVYEARAQQLQGPARDEALRIAHALTPSPGHEVRLHVVTGLAANSTPCNGRMTCPCATCETERAAAAQRQRRRTPRQPWHARPARQAA